MDVDGDEGTLQFVTLQATQLVRIKVVGRLLPPVQLPALVLQPVVTNVLEGDRQIQRIVGSERRGRTESPKPVEGVGWLHLFRERQYPGQLDHRCHPTPLEIKTIPILAVLLDNESAEEPERRLEFDTVGSQLAEKQGVGRSLRQTPCAIGLGQGGVAVQVAASKKTAVFSTASGVGAVTQAVT